MQPLREQIYGQLTNGTTYTLEQLSRQYRVSEPVIEVQLQRLKDEGKQIEVSDDEVYLLLDHAHKIWPYVFWIMIGLLFALMIGVMDG